MAQDFYDVLGVERGADPDTIKKAYRKMAMKYHPDKNPGDKAAEEKFKEAASAYEILSDPKKKAQYDRFGHVGGPGAGGFQGFTDVNDIFESFSDIFGDFFGGGGTRRQQRSGPRRGADLRYLCEVRLEEVMSGAEKTIEFETDAGCKGCKGSGAKTGTSAETCAHCGGSGQVVRAQGFFSMATGCPVCRGSGKVIKDPCAKCHGTGREKVKRKIQVSIPAGVTTGTQLRVAGEGEGGYLAGPTGDLFVEIQVAKHRQFLRRGRDLYAPLRISYVRGLLGGEVETETLTGRTLLRIPKGTETGQMVRLQGKGVPGLGGAKPGDLCFEIQVEIPKKLQKEEEQLLHRIAEIRGETVGEESSGIFSRWGKK